MTNAVPAVETLEKLRVLSRFLWLVFRGRVHFRHAKYWLDVASEPVYEMWVSRLRNKMGQESRLRVWEKIMKRHTKLRKQEK